MGFLDNIVDLAPDQILLEIRHMQATDPVDAVALPHEDFCRLVAKMQNRSPQHQWIVRAASARIGGVDFYPVYDVAPGWRPAGKRVLEVEIFEEAGHFNAMHYWTYLTKLKPTDPEIL